MPWLVSPSTGSIKPRPWKWGVRRNPTSRFDCGPPHLDLYTSTNISEQAHENDPTHHAFFASAIKPPITADVIKPSITADVIKPSITADVIKPPITADVIKRSRRERRAGVASSTADGRVVLASSMADVWMVLDVAVLCGLSSRNRPLQTKRRLQSHRGDLPRRGLRLSDRRKPLRFWMRQHHPKRRTLRGVWKGL